MSTAIPDISDVTATSARMPPAPDGTVDTISLNFVEKQIAGYAYSVSVFEARLSAAIALSKGMENINATTEEEIDSLQRNLDECKVMLNTYTKIKILINEQESVK